MLACAALASFPNRESRTKTFSAEMVADILLDRPPHRNPAPLHPPITYLLLSFFFNSDSFGQLPWLRTGSRRGRLINSLAKLANERKKKDFFISRFLFFFSPSPGACSQANNCHPGYSVYSRPLPSKGYFLKECGKNQSSCQVGMRIQ